jgi:hypothetical protein
LNNNWDSPSYRRKLQGALLSPMAFGSIGDDVKSFRFYLRERPELVTPSKLREEYSPDELAAFQAEFQRRWNRRKRWALPCYVGLGVWAVGMIAILLSAVIDGTRLLLLILAFLAIVAYAAVFLRFPRCPACTNETDEYPGEYCHFCPACGGTAIGPATWARAPECQVCGVEHRCPARNPRPARYPHRRYRWLHLRQHPGRGVSH